MWPRRLTLSFRWRALLPFALAAVALALALGTRQLEGRVGSPLPLAPTPRYHPSLARLTGPGEEPLDLARAKVPEPLVLRRGQTLGSLLGELGLSPPEVHAAAAALAEHLDVRKLRPGELGLAWFDADGLARLRLRRGDEGWVELSRRGAAWTTSWHAFRREVRMRRIEGRLEDSLEAAVRRAGGMPTAAYAMAEVLQWDLDFNRDLRVGDRFQVLYEEVYLDGEPAGLGEVRALVYETRGRPIEAYRFADGYYDAAGRPTQKMFLRSPLRFTRVTSRFSARRFHPVLKVHRPHYGVDYGAPVGTPVRVTASGTVIFVGRNGGAGKMVKVRHPNGYVTAYLHLSGYAVRRGNRVSQGDIVGYVGSTGLATGPHLDYRVQKDGRWVDPLRLTSEPAPPLSRRELARFLEQREALAAELAGGDTAPEAPSRRARRGDSEPQASASAR